MARPLGLQELVDLEEIRNLKHRYCRFVDTQQWERWRGLFTDDARVDSRMAEAGIDAFVANVAAFLEGGRSCHHTHGHEIVFTGPDSARGLAAQTDLVEWAPAGAGPSIATSLGDARSEARGVVGYGYYEEEYRRVLGEWKISYMRNSRLWVTQLAGPAGPTLANQLPPFPHWLDAAEPTH